MKYFQSAAIVVLSVAMALPAHAEAGKPAPQLVDVVQTETAKEVCKTEAIMLFQTAADRPVSFNFADISVSPASPTPHSQGAENYAPRATFSVDMSVSAPYADKRPPFQRSMTCSFNAYTASRLEFTGMALRRSP